jgi:type VI secretion system secreted protein Hcp
MISSRPSPLSRTLALVPPTVLLAAQYASGAFTAYIEIEGIKGEATEEAHKGWIEVGSVQWGVGRAISSPAGGNREASVPSISEITLTKTLDSTSPKLFLLAVGGGIPAGVTVKLHLVDTTGGTGTVFYELILSNVLVSSQSNSASPGDGRPQESISLNFTKIEVAYTPTDAKGAPGTPVRAGYDLATQKIL